MALDRVLHGGQRRRTVAEVEAARDRAAHLQELYARACSSRDPEDWAAWREELINAQE